MDTTKKRLIDVDRKLAGTHRNDINNVKRLVNSITVAYTRMRLGNLSIEEIPILLQNPAEFVYDKLTAGKPLTFGGIQVGIDKAKMMDILAKPQGYDAFITISKNAAEQIKSSGYDVKWLLERLSPDAAGTFEVSPEYLAELDEMCNVYAKTPEAEAVYDWAYNALQDLQEKRIPEAVSKNRFLRRDMSDFFGSLFKYDYKTNKFSISKEVLLSFNRVGAVHWKDR